MRLYIAVGIGGAIGTSARLIVTLFFFPENVHTFPYGTFLANVTGAFLLTFVTFLPIVRERMGPILFVAFTTGLIGSYTTFSTIILETYTLIQETLGLALVYLSVTVIGGLLASFLGMMIAKHLSQGREHVR